MKCLIKGYGGEKRLGYTALAAGRSPYLMVTKL
jgi:hypothetical protein